MPRWIIPAGFIVGCVFLATILGMVVAMPKVSPAQMNVIKTTQALAGAAFSMALSGFLTVKLNLPAKGSIVAGGTLAVFVILFFFAPGVGHDVSINGIGNIVVKDNTGPVTLSSAPVASTKK